MMKIINCTFSISDLQSHRDGTVGKYGPTEKYPRRNSNELRPVALTPLWAGPYLAPLAIADFMRALRHLVFQRFLSVGLLFSLTLWLAVPATGAARTTLAAQTGDLGLPADVESALSEALAGTRTAEDFAEALAATLAAQPDGDDLADLVAEEPSVLLALLYGHLFQALGYPDGPRAVPTVAAGATVGSAPAAAAVVQTADRADASYAAQRLATPDRVVRPVALLTAAQPLGP